MSLTRRGVGLLALAALSALVLPAPVAVGVFVISLLSTYLIERPLARKLRRRHAAPPAAEAKPAGA